MKLKYLSLLCALFCVASLVAMEQDSYEFDPSCPECQVCQCDRCCGHRSWWADQRVFYKPQRSMRWDDEIAKELAALKAMGEKEKKKGDAACAANVKERDEE